MFVLFEKSLRMYYKVIRYNGTNTLSRGIKGISWEQFMKNGWIVKNILASGIICIFCLMASQQLFAGDHLYGTVVETMNSGGYTYAQIEKDGTKRWVAVPETLLGVGDEVEFSSGLDMGQYTSKTLNRTFDGIIFSGGVVAVKKNEPVSEKKEQADEKIDIAKAQGPNGYRIATLYEKKAALAGSRVTVRGKVYKVSKFMGATWIRIKDGSGSRKKGNHKLIAIGATTVEKDAVVTLSGIVTVDKSVGGLSYDVVLEQVEIVEKEHSLPQ